MRCPKCQYITFDSGDRCRNCGYEFSLAPQTTDVDLRIQTGDEPEGPMSVPDPIPPRPITESFDLPLFSARGAPSDRPLVTPPAVPRVPLSVRKQAPVAPRAARKGAPEEPRLELSFPDEHRKVAASADADDAGEATTASAGARLLAAFLDALLLGGISAAVLHFTLKICRLEYSEIAALPLAPFLSFLLILYCGYVTAFTAAGGQSIGKMAAHIRVVPSDPNAWSGRVPLGQSALRAVAYVVSALPAGLGFVPALIGSEKRALHDRLAHTRVVKA